jgi:hypothetical protein
MNDIAPVPGPEAEEIADALELARELAATALAGRDPRQAVEALTLALIAVGGLGPVRTMFGG